MDRLYRLLLVVAALAFAGGCGLLGPGDGGESPPPDNGDRAVIEISATDRV
ncbi:MAG: hypothetical protein V5A48_08995 [Salinivenus sp.]